MKRCLALIFGIFWLAGCRLNPDCFRSDECNAGFVCVERVCVGATADAQVDAGDADVGAFDLGDAEFPDLDTGDLGPADVVGSDTGPLDAIDIDAGPTDASSHVEGVCRGATVAGNPLPNGRSRLPVGERDILLLHFDDPNNLGFNAAGYRAANTMCEKCTTDFCEVYDGSMSGGTLTYTFNNLGSLTVVDALHHLEAWVRWNGNSGCFIQTRTEMSGRYAWSLCVDTNGAIAPEQTATSTRVGSMLKQGNWHHIDVFYDDTRSFVWIDGVQNGGEYTFDSSTNLEVESIVITSAVVEIDELRLGATLSPDYLTSRSQPRVCAAYKRANELFVASDTLGKPRRLQGTGDFPRLAHDLQSVVYVQCNGDCSLIQEDLSTGSMTIKATGLQPGLPAAIDALGDFHYVLAAQPTVLVRQTPNMTYTLDLTQPITAFDVAWVDNPVIAPAALVATADPAGTPRIQVVDFQPTTAAISAVVPWDGVVAEEVIRLSVIGVDPIRSVLSSDYEGHWTATVRRDAGGDYLIFGNRNRCSPNCEMVDPATTLEATQTPDRYVTGFDNTGQLIINSEAAPVVLSQPGENSQLDLQWVID